MSKKFKHMSSLILEKRLATEISQSAMSIELGYKNGQFISNVERGQCTIPSKKFHLTAKLLNISIKELIKAYKQDVQDNIIRDINVELERDGMEMDLSTGFVK